MSHDVTVSLAAHSALLPGQARCPRCRCPPSPGPASNPGTGHGVTAGSQPLLPRRGRHEPVRVPRPSAGRIPFVATTIHPIYTGLPKSPPPRSAYITLGQPGVGSASAIGSHPSVVNRNNLLSRGPAPTPHHSSWNACVRQFHRGDRRRLVLLPPSLDNMVRLASRSDDAPWWANASCRTWPIRGRSAPHERRQDRFFGATLSPPVLDTARSAAAATLSPT